MMKAHLKELQCDKISFNLFPVFQRVFEAVKYAEKCLMYQRIENKQRYKKDLLDI